MNSEALPNGLVLSTNNTSQSYVERDRLLTLDDIMTCETENFVEYIDELAEKAILLKQIEDPYRGVITPFLTKIKKDHRVVLRYLFFILE